MRPTKEQAKDKVLELEEEISIHEATIASLRSELALNEKEIESLKEDINDLNLKIIIQDFTKKFKEGIQDMPPHIAAIVNKHFFELL